MWRLMILENSPKKETTGSDRNVSKLYEDEAPQGFGRWTETSLNYAFKKNICDYVVDMTATS